MDESEDNVSLTLSAHFSNFDSPLKEKKKREKIRDLLYDVILREMIALLSTSPRGYYFPRYDAI